MYTNFLGLTLCCFFCNEQGIYLAINSGQIMLIKFVKIDTLGFELSYS